MSNTYDRITNQASKILDLLDDVSASLENVLLAHGKDMTPADFAARSKRCKEARELCDELLRPAAEQEEE